MAQIWRCSVEDGDQCQVCATFPLQIKPGRDVMFSRTEGGGGADVLPLPGWVPCHGGSLAQSQHVSTEDIAWPFQFVFLFEICKCLAKYDEEGKTENFPLKTFLFIAFFTSSSSSPVLHSILIF